MNIFVTHECPEQSAKYLDDKRVNKMMVETVQLLSTAVNIRSGKPLGPYRTTHANHPCSLWARESLGNWCWLMAHAQALSREFYRRFGKQHKSSMHLRTLHSLGLQYIPPGELTPFVNCARNSSLGIDIHCENVHMAYREYLKVRWESDVRPAVATYRRY